MSHQNNNQNPYGGNAPQQPNGQQFPQGQQTVYVVQQPKKAWYKRAVIMVPLTLVFLFILFVGGCMALVGGVANEMDKESKKEHNLTYVVEGDAQDATATYHVGDSDSTQDSGIAAGWKKDVTVKGFFGAYLSVTNGIYDTGTVTCKILVDGKTVTENTATGEFATATCDASTTELEEAVEGDK
ncbi:hypothetical protein [Corynebacterium jeikeium]|uniref:hypothetical protein n=1 Tax=Corynebacterium jeikeium TaxID=38289 RepID=UPI00087EBE6C|nr:hypothetical protein [Corynebacterium jeikeium]SCW99604.1 hypothetical protein CJBVI_0009 [Corynebacterium jeikeium]